MQGSQLVGKIKQIQQLHHAGTLSALDFVSSYIILHVQARERERWLGGRLEPPPPLSPSDPGVLGTPPPPSLPISQASWLEFSEADHRKFQKTGAERLVDIFGRFQLRKIPTYVNCGMMAWALGLRRVLLLFHIPSPYDVLLMQAKGERCLTAFCEPFELERVLQDHCMSFPFLFPLSLPSSLSG